MAALNEGETQKTLRQIARDLIDEAREHFVCGARRSFFP